MDYAIIKCRENIFSRSAQIQRVPDQNTGKNPQGCRVESFLLCVCILCQNSLGQAGNRGLLLVMHKPVPPCALNCDDTSEKWSSVRLPSAQGLEMRTPECIRFTEGDHRLLVQRTVLGPSMVGLLSSSTIAALISSGLFIHAYATVSMVKLRALKGFFS